METPPKLSRCVLSFKIEQDRLQDIKNYLLYMLGEGGEWRVTIPATPVTLSVIPLNHQRASLSKQCITDYNVLSWHIMDNSRICHCLLFHGKQNFVQPFFRSRMLLRLHTWTKLHNKIMRCIIAVMSVDYAWPLLEANSTTVRDWTVPSVSSLPLIVCHGQQLPCVR